MADPLKEGQSILVQTDGTIGIYQGKYCNDKGLCYYTVQMTDGTIQSWDSRQCRRNGELPG
jgi:hypothetical protein